MNSRLSASFLQIPTARQLIDLIQDDLREGRSVLGLLPEGIDPSFLRSALWDGLAHWHLSIHEVPISPGAQSPASALGQALGVDWGNKTAPRTVENLLKQAGLPEILFLDGFEELAEKDRVQWLRFMVQWAQVCQGRQSTDISSPALCLLVRASNVPYPYIDSTNVFLTIRPWWGIPTILEMRLLCRLASAQDTTPLGRWREYIIPALSGSDLSLGDYLWDKIHRTSQNLVGALQDFACDRGWIKEELEALPDFQLSQNSGPLSSAHLYQAWARGLVHWTPEYGLECHSALLAMLGRQECLDHRLWRGQPGFLLPDIDKVRLALCFHLNRYGSHWPYKWQEPENSEELQAVRDSPFACQLGHLESLLLNCQDLHLERRWISLVRRSRQIRNHLAHYRPISLNDYEGFCREVKRGYQAGLMTS